MKKNTTTFVMLLALLTIATPSLAQTPQPPLPGTPVPPSAPPPPGVQVPPPLPLALGSACTRKTDNRIGVVKKDGCGRMYCGRTDIQDITEVRPNFAADNGCAWTVVAGHCKCQKIMSRPRP